MTQEVKDQLEKFVWAANEYSGINYNFNCFIVDWKGDKAIIGIQDQDEEEIQNFKVLVHLHQESWGLLGSGDHSNTWTIENDNGEHIADTNRPWVLFAILYV